MLAEAKSGYLEISKIRTDGGTQPRASVVEDVVDDYAHAVQNGAVFPPVTVFYDGNDYWLADGFHRLAGHKMARATQLPTEVKQGTRRDAVLYSVGANSQHGLRRTNEDKRRAVTTLLNDSEWSGWSNTEIARRCAVSKGTVRNMRNTDTSQNTKYQRTYIHPKTGLPTYMQTANIGRPAPTAQNDNSAVSQPINPVASPRLQAYSGDNEWYTPSRYVEMARNVLGTIDVDPASNEIAQQTVQAGQFFTSENDGLGKPWFGRVWMNPPYSNPEIQQFAAKIIGEYIAGRCTEAIVLTNNSGDTAWHHDLCSVAKCWCITKGRIKFESPTRESGAGAMGQVFFYFGENEPRFKSVFSEIGRVDTAL